MLSALVKLEQYDGAAVRSVPWLLRIVANAAHGPAAAPLGPARSSRSTSDSRPAGPAARHHGLSGGP